MVETTVIMNSPLVKPIGFTLAQMADYAWKKGNEIYAKICMAALEAHCVSYRFGIHQYVGSDQKVRKYVTLTVQFLGSEEKNDFWDRYSHIVAETESY